MEAQEVHDLLDYAPYLVALAGSIAMIAAAWIRYRRSPHQAVAVKSTAIKELVESVAMLAERLNESQDAIGVAQAARLRDCLNFEQDISSLREELSSKYDARLREMKTYHEGRIARIEQGHRDRVEALKLRIKELELRLDNGDKERKRNAL